MLIRSPCSILSLDKDQCLLLGMVSLVVQFPTPGGNRGQPTERWIRLHIAATFGSPCCSTLLLDPLVYHCNVHPPCTPPHTRWSANFCDASEQNSLCEQALPTPLVQTKNCAPAFCVARSTSHDLSPHVLESSAHRWLHPPSLHVHGLVWMVLGASVGSHLVRLVRRSTSWKTPCKWTCNGPQSVT